MTEPHDASNAAAEKPAEQAASAPLAPEQASALPEGELARLTDAKLVAHRVGQVLCLVLLSAPAAQAYHFLQRDHVRVQFTQHLRHP